MSEKVETPKILDEISKNTQNTKSAKTKAASKNGNVLTLVLLVGMIALGAVAYSVYLQQQSAALLAALESQNEQLQSTVSAQQSRIDSLQGTLTEIQTTQAAPVTIDDSLVRDLEAELRSELTTIEANLNEVRALQATDTQSPDFEWKLFEADYLIGVANQKLKLEADFAAAIAMLESADRALLASGSSRVFSLRQSLANDLSNLRSVQNLDREGIYVQLGSLIQEVDDMDLLSSFQDNYNQNFSGNTGPMATGNSGVIDGTLQFLSSVFVWRRWDETPASMLTPEQGMYIKQNLRLMLEQGQLALLTKDQKLFVGSLNKSTDWISRYALLESDAGQRLVQSLNELAVLNIDPELPSIDSSVDLSNQLTLSER